jgi:septum formation protein
MTHHNPVSRKNPLILASLSPRRKDILTQIGIPFQSVGSRVGEVASKRMKPDDFACLMANRKAESVKKVYRKRWILAADTLVVVNKKMFGKPKDVQECRSMLLDLSGRRHRVITGFCILDPDGNKSHREAVSTRVTVKELSALEIDAYIETAEPFDKAGAYAIQGIGAFMVKGIEGSYSNVVGLPICEVVRALIICGALKGFPITPKLRTP